MALSFATKKVVVKEVNILATEAMSIGVAKYKGLTVAEITNLRLLAFDAKVHLRVVKNTLAQRALAKTTCECVIPLLKGPTILGFSKDDPSAVARVFSQFLEGNNRLVVQGFGVCGKFVEAEQLKYVVNLPTKEQAISMVMALMLAPLNKLCRVLNEIPTKIARVVAAVRDQKNNK